jgi:putative peptidoglycan lipid II flippase
MTFILAAPFFSMKKPKIPMTNSVLMFILNISLAVLLMKYMKVNGIALAASLTYLVSMLRMYFLLQREVGKITDRLILGSIGKIVLISIIMVLVMIAVKMSGIGLLFDYNLFGKLARLSIISLSGVGSFFLTAKLVRLPEIGSIKSTLQHIFFTGK